MRDEYMTGADGSENDAVTDSSARTGSDTLWITSPLERTGQQAPHKTVTSAGK